MSAYYRNEACVARDLTTYAAEHGAKMIHLELAPCRASDFLSI